jgi:hypothetical protein
MNNIKVNLTTYSCGDNYTVSWEGTNHSRIITKMVHLAGRICEQYASDIVYDANFFIEAIENKKDYDRYLFFRESGVTALAPEDIECIHGISFIQVWHLTYNAKTEYQEFTRMHLFFERSLV